MPRDEMRMGIKEGGASFDTRDTIYASLLHAPRWLADAALERCYMAGRMAIFLT